jgi:hypothetical protein
LVTKRKLLLFTDKVRGKAAGEWLLYANLQDRLEALPLVDLIVVRLGASLYEKPHCWVNRKRAQCHQYTF